MLCKKLLPEKAVNIIDSKLFEKCGVVPLTLSVQGGKRGEILTHRIFGEPFKQGIKVGSSHYCKYFW